jgi:CRP-like cAMP-binding protein
LIQVKAARIFSKIFVSSARYPGFSYDLRSSWTLGRRGGRLATLATDPNGALKMTDERKDIHNSDLPVICRACEARHKGGCGALTPTQLVDLAKHTQRRERPSGDVLLRDGDPIESHANIMRGVVKLSKGLPDGRQQIVGLQFAPDFLGRPLTSENTMTAEAASDVMVRSFPKSVLDRLISENRRWNPVCLSRP